MRMALRFSLLLGLAGLLGSCGYTLRGNTREFFNQNGIRSLYVAPVKNLSYKPGVEIVIYNALRKRIAQGGYVRIVDQPGQADAEIEAKVLDASYAASGITTADQIAPVQTGRSPRLIPSTSGWLSNFSSQVPGSVSGGTRWHDRRLSRLQPTSASSVPLPR